MALGTDTSPGVTHPRQSPGAGRRLVKALLSRPEIAALAMLVVVIVGFHVNAPQFLSEANIRVILQVVPELGLVALGVTLLMIAGEFDLSVGSVFALVPMATVLMMGAGIDPWLAIFAGLAIAAAIGYANGIITIAFSIPSFVTTLGMLFMARSVAVVLSGGFPPPFPKDAPVEVFVGQPEIFGYEITLFRASLLWFVGLGILLGLLLHRSNFGNWVYATGGQPQAAADMGINVRRVKLTCFMLCSTLAGFAGIVQTFRLKATLPSIGEGLELQAIAAAVIGGSALTGGIGSVLGAVVGTVLIRVIDNGLVMARIDANWFKFAIGALTVVAVILNIYIRRRALKMKV